MRGVIAIAAGSLIWASTGAGASERCGADGVPAGAVLFKEFVIPDLSLSAKDRLFPYIALLAPADWIAEGALSPRKDHPCGLRAALGWRAASPDGRSTIEVVPDDAWTASRWKAQFSSCPSRAVFHAAAYAEDLLKKRGVKATIAEVRAREDIAAPWRRPLTAAGETQADAVEIDFRTEPAADGAAGADMLAIAAIAISAPGMGIPENEERAYALPALIATAPPGTLDRELVEAVRASAIVNPGWASADQRKSGGEAPDAAFPERAAGAPTAKCGSAFAPLGIRQLWRRDDGRAYFIPEK